uniref:Uncharacterized protein n=1 Tax=Mola mola TaxID=94237 RepID=A0A3Q4B7R1_MOLML
MHTSVCRVHNSSDPDSSYFLRVDWSERGLASGFQLLLTDGQDAWRGEVSAAAVCSEAAELEMQTERYIQDLQQALTENSTTYSFNLKPSPPAHGSNVTLAYEKVQKDISFRLGSVLLKAVPEPAEAVRELLIYGLQRGNAMEHHNQKLEEENQRLRAEQQRVTAELKRYASGKEALEAELYSRFVLVLNEKKFRCSCYSCACFPPHSVNLLKAEDKWQVSIMVIQSLKLIFSSTVNPLDDNLRDITDVAPCRKRRIRQLGAPDPVVKRPNPQNSKRKRYTPVSSCHIYCLFSSLF